MEPIIGHEAVNHDDLLVHTWRVAQLTRPSSPGSASRGRWPRPTPTTLTGIRSPGWYSAAARRAWPSASSADEPHVPFRLAGRKNGHLPCGPP